MYDESFMQSSVFLLDDVLDESRGWYGPVKTAQKNTPPPLGDNLHAQQQPTIPAAPKSKPVIQSTD
jgi:hypothetical protein